MRDLTAAIAARLERAADRMNNAKRTGDEARFRAAAAQIRSGCDLASALELERQLFESVSTPTSTRVHAFAATSEYDPNDPEDDPNDDPDTPGQDVEAPAMPMGPPAYTVKVGVTVDPGTAQSLYPIADNYANATGGQQINISDASRTAADQAQAMYNNYVSGHVAPYVDASLEQQIHDAYTSGTNAGDSQAAIVASMTDIIQTAADNGELISKHMADGRAFDVSTVDSTGKPIDLAKLQAAAAANGYTVLKEFNHYHVQPK